MKPWIALTLGRGCMWMGRALDFVQLTLPCMSDLVGGSVQSPLAVGFSLTIAGMDGLEGSSKKR